MRKHLPNGSGKGMCPKAAAYSTQTDHRAQVERADTRRAKKRIRKARRRLERRLCDGDTDAPDDVMSMSRRDRGTLWNR
jgi:hypothetical protein